MIIQYLRKECEILSHLWYQDSEDLGQGRKTWVGTITKITVRTWCRLSIKKLTCTAVLRLQNMCFDAKSSALGLLMCSGPCIRHVTAQSAVSQKWTWIVSQHYWVLDFRTTLFPPALAIYAASHILFSPGNNNCLLALVLCVCMKGHNHIRDRFLYEGWGQRVNKKKT